MRCHSLSSAWDAARHIENVAVSSVMTGMPMTDTSRPVALAKRPAAQDEQALLAVAPFPAVPAGQSAHAEAPL